MGFIVEYGQYLRSNLKCTIVNVYAMCNMKDIVALWEDLLALKSATLNLAWCFVGDFNVVRRSYDRKGVRVCGSQKSEIFGFNNFIDRNLLVEFPVVGKKYAWYKSNVSAKIRIDRVLVFDDWLQQWPMGKQYILSREISDHCVIVVKSSVKDWGPKPFRFIDVWLMEPGFKDMVRDNWNSYSGKGNSIYAFKGKLKSLKVDLKVWNRDVFGHLESEKKNCLMEIEELDVKDEGDALPESLRTRRLVLINRVEEINKKLESMFR
ncbi:uncharacterized protein [Phaseolus vulgaris]|uniref:uncharacterized protein n=1 Tax=Phaseolus vulgaris TaxID=3885 RepID=UPI0035CAF844